jgi:hypothetical protein
MITSFKNTRERNAGIMPVRPAGFQPAAISLRRQDAREPHSLEGCVPICRIAASHPFPITLILKFGMKSQP